MTEIFGELLVRYNNRIKILQCPVQLTYKNNFRNAYFKDIIFIKKEIYNINLRNQYIILL